MRRIGMSFACVHISQCGGVDDHVRTKFPNRRVHGLRFRQIKTGQLTLVEHHCLAKISPQHGIKVFERQGDISP
jgi:hypothetical protein